MDREAMEGDGREGRRQGNCSKGMTLCITDTLYQLTSDNIVKNCSRKAKCTS